MSILFDEKEPNDLEAENPFNFEIDSLDELLSLSNMAEMDQRILKNTASISKIFKATYTKLCDTFVLSREETDKFIYCLKFVDTLNIFMPPGILDSLSNSIYDIGDMVHMIKGLDNKDFILKKIRYTEMTYVYYKKKQFKTLFFGDGNFLGSEIERHLSLVTINGGFDQKLFKQMQNIFWVTQGKIEEKYRAKIQTRFNNLKVISVQSKKGRYNYYEDCDDYSDYKNFSQNANDQTNYYDKFNENYINSQMKPNFPTTQNNIIINNFKIVNDFNNGEKVSNEQNNQNKAKPTKNKKNKNLTKKNINLEAKLNALSYLKDYEGNNSIPNLFENNNFVGNKQSNEETELNLADIPTPIKSNPDNLENDTNIIEEKITKRGLNLLKSETSNNEDFASVKNTKKNNLIKINESAVKRISKDVENNGGYSSRSIIEIDVDKIFSNEEEDKNKIEDKLKEETQAEPKAPEPKNKEDELSYEDENKTDSFVEEFEDDYSQCEELQEVKKLINEVQMEDNNDDANSSGSYDKDEVQAQFDKFMQEAKLKEGNNKNTQENKNNKIIFDDDSTAAIKKSNLKYEPIKEIKESNVEVTSANNRLEELSKEKESELKVKDSTKVFMESLKSIDPAVISEIRGRLNSEAKKLENQIKPEEKDSTIKIDSTVENNDLNNDKVNDASQQQMENFPFQFNFDEIIKAQAQYGKLQIHNYIFANNAHFFFRGRDSNIHREYFSLKCFYCEKNPMILNNIELFENKILIPLYQRINANVNSKRQLYYYTYSRYKKLIYRVLTKENILNKVKPYGSYMNNFLIDSGDIDICIVPTCGILEFANYLEQIKDEVISQNYGEHQLTHHTSRYLLLKFIDKQTNFVIDITVHNQLPILNTSLIRLYSLYDQRFHILGLYIKHWGKINKIHGAADNFLSSYAMLLMLINFLQNVAEPKILPNLQKVENKEVEYEYTQNGEVIKTNIYFEEDLEKIKISLQNSNNGKVNTESASELLIKFFEYYSYNFDSFRQKISIHNEPNSCFKKTPDNFAFSIEDPFDPTHNPGKSMNLNTVQYAKFITSMKREINFLFSGEYVKRLEKIIN